MYRRLLSVKQTAEILNLSVLTIYRMVKEGRIEARKLGHRVLIDPEVLGLKEVPEQPEVKEPVKVEVKQEKPVFESILKDLIPELDRAFRNAPAYGELGFRVVLHDSQVVRVETSTSVSKLVNKNGRL